MTTNLAMVDRDGPVATLRLNRPDAHNALSLDLLNALRSSVREIGAMSDVHVCVVTGEGKSFCAGMDLRAVLDDPDAPGRLLREIAELTIELRALPMVTIAHVNGAAIGGGCGLMCVCDLAMTHADAKLGFPEVGLGVCPAVVAPWVAASIGPGAARRMLLTGGLMSGVEAHQRGLVTRLASTRDELATVVSEAVERLRGAGPRAIAATKSWLNDMEESRLSELVRRGAVISADVISDPNARAALKRAFESRGR